MNRADVIRRRLRSERLVGTPFASPLEAVAGLGAVQSQDYAGAKWGLAQRCAGVVTGAQIDALFDAGKILRTHVMRPTWHFVAPGDLRWLLKLTAPRVHQANAYSYRQQELDAAIFRKSEAAIEKALRGGRSMTRDELAGVLKRVGVAASGTRLACIAMHAELEGLICSGPLRGKKFTYALIEERVPQAKSLSREEALAELTRRFFISHGPAQAQDFAYWSGLTAADVRAGLAAAGDELVQENVEGKAFWFSPVPDEELPETKAMAALVHLLPNYDEFVAAFRDGYEVLAPDVKEALARKKDGLAVHIIAAGGRVVGGWRREIFKREVAVTTDLLRALSRREGAALQRAAEAYGRHLELPVRIEAR